MGELMQISLLKEYFDSIFFIASHDIASQRKCPVISVGENRKSSKPLRSLG